MMRMPRYVLSLLAVLMLLGVSGSVMGADFQKGKDAYEKKDYATALREWRPLAEQGKADAQYGLAGLYQLGKGVPENIKTALKWYRLSANQGHPRAQRLLGLIYELGNDPIQQNYDAALKWYSLAANQGDASGQYYLAWMYFEGKGVPIDYVNAHRWWNIAASQNKKGALELLNRVAIKMTKNQIARAQQLARNFVPIKPKPPQIAKVTPRPKQKRRLGSSGSGFFISKLGHIITNQHVVNKCKRVTVGDNAKKQVSATVIETDRRNDLALLRISKMTMASAETKSLITKLGISVVPLATEGLFRSAEIELGEDVLVAGYPFGDVFSNTIKVTKGIVSANRGAGDDTGQFQIDAAVQPGNSGGPIYDEYGNIVGVVVAQLNKLKFAKRTGAIPENVNFGIKASTVRQFLNASGLPTKWSKRSKAMSTRDLAKIAKNQTVMVVCHR
jgi:S1-C subfamily serine protease